MSGQPSLERREQRYYAGIPIRASLSEWYRVNALVPEIYEWLARNGIVPLGGPVYRYRTIGDHEREFDLDVGVPTAGPVTGDGRVHAGILPAGRYAVMIHHGHPDQQVRSHEALQAWVKAQGLAFALAGANGTGGDEVWTARCESYLTNPAEEPDLTKWSTELAYLLKD